MKRNPFVIALGCLLLTPLLGAQDARPPVPPDRISFFQVPFG